ncbi:hypothetical protein MBLNU457_5575t1 [Dothideomycetes sp. NU457]
MPQRSQTRILMPSLTYLPQLRGTINTQQSSDIPFGQKVSNKATSNSFSAPACRDSAPYQQTTATVTNKGQRSMCSSGIAERLCIYNPVWHAGHSRKEVESSTTTQEAMKR